jgi:hypothetical protein
MAMADVDSNDKISSKSEKFVNPFSRLETNQEMRVNTNEKGEFFKVTKQSESHVQE